MLRELNAHFIPQICLVIFAVITYIFFDKRYKKNHGTDIPDGFEKTQEVTIDPTSGKKLRIYYNNKTGERFYCEEKNYM